MRGVTLLRRCFQPVVWLGEMLGSLHCVFAAEEMSVDCVSDLAWEVEKAETCWLHGWLRVGHA